MSTSVISEFSDALVAAGIPCTNILADGKMHRYASNGDSQKNSWYVLHGDGVPSGAYGCWKRDINEKWRANGSSFSPEEEEIHRRRVERAEKEHRLEIVKRHGEGRAEAISTWERSKVAPADHPYLVAKGIKAHGLKVTEDGRLIVPMFSDADLQTLQFISPSGEKRFLTGGRVIRCYFGIGKDWKTFCICEGFATAAAIHEATGRTVVATFTAHNLLPTARDMRRDFPSARIVLCADDDWKTPGNSGVTKAEEAAKAVGGMVVIPMFGADRGEKDTDFNDMRRLYGGESIMKIIEDAAKDPDDKLSMKEWIVKHKNLVPGDDSMRGIAFPAPGPAVMKPPEVKKTNGSNGAWVLDSVGPGVGAPGAEPTDNFKEDKFEAKFFTREEVLGLNLSPPFIVENYLYRDLAILAAAGGGGKTTLCLWEAAHIALGIELYGNRVSRCKTLYVTGEDSAERLGAMLREVMKDLSLDDDQKDICLKQIGFLDLLGGRFRLCELDSGGNARHGKELDKFIDELRKYEPGLIIFDPLASFGASEETVNTAAQGAVNAGRRISKELSCCVRIIHHTGQQVFRENIVDQYTSRGGTALPDGARMVASLSRPGKDDISPFKTTKSGDSLSMLTITKLSYARIPPRIFLKRSRYGFEYSAEIMETSKEKQAGLKEQVTKFLDSQLRQGRSYTKRTLREMGSVLKISERVISTIVANLISEGEITEEELPEDHRQGRRKTYLKPTTSPAIERTATFDENRTATPGLPGVLVQLVQIGAEDHAPMPNVLVQGGAYLQIDPHAPIRGVGEKFGKKFCTNTQAAPIEYGELEIKDSLKRDEEEDESGWGYSTVKADTEDWDDDHT